ncbi:MAG TPA: GNAT family N-acetyltransferase [Flavobacteriaceae bacterium]|nr:GNAT family N-acetyltransferase [Flavobacteriaceae bacterium]
MEIRAANRNDSAIVLKLMNHAILNTTSIYDTHLRNEAYFHAWFSNKQKNNFPVFICEIQGKPVAFGTYDFFRSGSAYNCTVEHSIHVLGDFQGRKIGKTLMEKLMESAKQEGKHAMVAGIDSENKVSLNFHSKMGFREKGRFPEIAFKFGRWLDLVMMQLLLKSP